MRIVVEFQDQQLDFEVEDNRLIGFRPAPGPSQRQDVPSMVRAAIEAPRDFPPLLQAVVPGDRVVIPIDPDLPHLLGVLGVVVESLRTSEVESITLVSTEPAPEGLPEGVVWKVHDPDESSEIAYLATTSEEKRIYLSRLLTDADLVIPIGGLGYDRSIGYRGPWSVIYPSMSNRETIQRFGALTIDGPLDPGHPSAGLRESFEVSWLLGCQFHLGVLPGSVLAGLESTIRPEMMAAVDLDWSFSVSERADVVIAGIGEPGQPTSIDRLTEGLAAAAGLVRRGGKIVALSQATGEPGPALQRIRGLDDIGAAAARLRGHEADPDYAAARRLASALAWADVYLHGDLDPDLVDDLGMIAIDRPEDSRRLAARAASCTLLSRAERVRPRVAGED